MSVILIACLCSFIALVSGILAVGSGSFWEYEPKDILRGRKNALLYIWVTFSTMFSLVHTAACIQYALIPVWGTGTEIQMWFALHALVGILLTSAHAYIRLVMKDGTATQKYLWGPRCV